MNHLTAIVLAFLITFSIPSQGQFQYQERAATTATASTPLLILLHGYGSNEADLFSLSNQLPTTYQVIAARAPMKVSDNGYAWYALDFSGGKKHHDFKSEESTRLQLIAFIEAMKKKYHAPSVYLFGFSQGAIMSYNIALTRPDLVQGIAVMSGRLLDEIKPLTASATKLSSVRIFISHGTNDQVLPFSEALAAEAWLKSKGLKPICKHYSAGHEINAVMLRDFLAWLPK